MTILVSRHFCSMAQSGQEAAMESYSDEFIDDVFRDLAEGVRAFGEFCQEPEQRICAEEQEQPVVDSSACVVQDSDEERERRAKQKWEFTYQDRNQYTKEDVMDLRAETEVANQMGLKWQQRGPPGPDVGGPTTWRGQTFRVNSRKWAKRGGKAQQYYKEKYGPTGWGRRLGIQPQQASSSSREAAAAPPQQSSSSSREAASAPKAAPNLQVPPPPPLTRPWRR